MNELSLGRFAARARKELRLGQVSILLTSDREIRDLNRTFRKKDKATDVLSFPPAAGVQHKFSGDIAISVDYASRSAQRFGLELQQELKILVLHGLIHLSGHDHERDGGEMARVEARLRRKLGLPTGLIARTEKQNHHKRGSGSKVGTMPRRGGTISSGESTNPRRAKAAARP